MTLAGRRVLDAGQLGDALVGQPREVVQDHGQGLIRWKPEDGLLYATAFLVAGICALGIRSLVRELDAIHVQIQRDASPRAAPRGGAAVVATHVERHRDEPGRGIATKIELADSAADLEEYLLREILGLFRASREAPHEGEDAIYVMIEELSERFRVAGPSWPHPAPVEWRPMRGRGPSRVGGATSIRARRWIDRPAGEFSGKLGQVTSTTGLRRRVLRVLPSTWRGHAM